MNGTCHVAFFKRAITTLFIALPSSSSSLWAAIAIDTVPIGNPGNVADTAVMGDGTSGYGSVGYVYNIGKYEVTVGQYAAFLNAVAATADTYGLYNPSMTSDLNTAGIAQIGFLGNYTYSVIGSPNHPVTYINWGDAARFANWLHNGQPAGAQDSSTTEDGAYTLNGATSDAALFPITRNAGAKWFIPSENEWYKAAFHQPSAQGGDSDNYWNYPMRTNSVPFSDQPPGATPDNTRVGNFYEDDGLPNGYDDGYAATGSSSYSSSQNYLTDVGAYASSPSFYGTFDQGGNAFEWNDAQINGVSRGARGGAFGNDASVVEAAMSRYDIPPTYDNTALGFRVATIPATVPEPVSVALGFIAGILAFAFQRRSR
jgi:sulfatase modifying factor 1